jgi:hypothetical protein
LVLDAGFAAIPHDVEIKVGSWPANETVVIPQ